MNSAFPDAVPEIPVRKIDDAVLYYRNSLDFTLDWRDQDLGLAGISREIAGSSWQTRNFGSATERWADHDLAQSGKQISRR